MIFTRLTITNFGVYQGRNEFALRPHTHGDDVRPIVLFSGQNGSGKTTILEAIRLCLYGRDALGNRVRRSDYETYIRQRLHRNPAQHTLTLSANVALRIDHTHAGVRSTYDAARSWRLDGQRIDEQTSIYKDGRPLHEIATEHWNDFLRDLIPPGVSDLFFFDGEQIQALADDEREVETLTAAIRGLLNLDLVDRLRSDLSIYLRQQEQHDRSRLQQAVDEADMAHRALDERRLERVQDQAQVQSRLEWMGKEINRVRQRLLSEGAGFINQRDALEARRKEVEKHLKETHEAIRELAAYLLPFALAPHWCLHLHQRLQDEAAAEQSHLVHETQHQQAAQIALTLLDTQFQTQTAPSVEPQEWAQIASAVQALLQPDNATASVEVRHSLSHQDRDTLAAWIASATQQVPQQMHTLAQQLEQLEAEQSDLEQKLRQVPDEAVITPLIEEFQRLSHEKGRLEAQQAQIEDELKQYRYQLDQLDRERIAAWKRLADAGDSDARVERAAKARVILEAYQQQIKEIKLQELEHAVADYFNRLCRKQMLVHEVTIDRQRFTITLYGANRTLLPKSDLSAGEKQLYAIALLWALRSVSGRALPIIIDTPMGRLDSNHRETMLTQFLPHAAHQVLLLATDTEIDPQAYALLQPAISHSFRLEFDQEQGSTQVVDGYAAEPVREVAV